MSSRYFSVEAGALDPKQVDSLIVPLDFVKDKDKVTVKDALAFLPATLREPLVKYAERIRFEVKAKKSFSVDVGQWRVVVCVLSEPGNMFEMLGLARKVLEPIKDSHGRKVGVDLRHVKDDGLELVDALVSAVVAADFTFKKYRQKAEPAAKQKDSVSLSFHVAAPMVQAIRARAASASYMTEGTNLVRELAKRVANDLTCKNYVAFAKDLAAKEGVGCEVLTQTALEKMKAGAFLAVAQGSAHRDAAIVKLSTRQAGRKGKRPHLVLVGKGIVFDSGGVNVKTAAHMFGMHGDMAGSAVALALLVLALREKWPVDVTVYLAIADNAIGNVAYRPNEVVTSLKGTTIEIVHTDAEGRMVLADTLHLASGEKADLIMDFATLTGACVGAIGTTYAGVFSNRPDLQSTLQAAGRRAGERVWMFPLDADFGECLESDVADIKQCRLKGGVDHIEAAHFLRHFVGEERPWVHVDLSANEHEGGLAHVPGDVTGFGVRFASWFAKAFFQIK